MAQIGVILDRVQYIPSAYPRQPEVENNCSRMLRPAEGNCVFAIAGGQDLETFLVSIIENDLGELGIVFDDQQDFIAGLEVVAVIRYERFLAVGRLLAGARGWPEAFWLACFRT